MELIDDEVEYQIEVAKSIYIMCGVFLVFIVGMAVERTKQARSPVLPVYKDGMEN